MFTCGAISHVPDGKQYIGSSLDLYSRLNDHLNGVSSNIRLQRTITKSGLNNFMRWQHGSCHRSCGRNYIIKEATSMLGYKHTAEAIAKMKKRL